MMEENFFHNRFFGLPAILNGIPSALALMRDNCILNAALRFHIHDSAFFARAINACKTETFKHAYNVTTRTVTINCLRVIAYVIIPSHFRGCVVICFECFNALEHFKNVKCWRKGK